MDNHLYDYYLSGVKQNGLLLQHVPKKLRTEEVWNIAVGKNALYFKEAPLELRKQKCEMDIKRWTITGSFRRCYSRIQN